jgi:hypothetical protein
VWNHSVFSKNRDRLIDPHSNDVTGSTCRGFLVPPRPIRGWW